MTIIAILIYSFILALALLFLYCAGEVNERYDQKLRELGE